MVPTVACRATFTKSQLSMLRPGARITKLGIFAAMILTAAGASCAADAGAADVVLTKASPATAASAPKPCTNLSDFIATNCQLIWQGITLYGTVRGAAGRAPARRLI